MSASRRSEARVVLVTVGSLREARNLAKAVVKKKLAACVNILLAPVDSIYRWKGKVEVAHEHLLMIKTAAHRYPALEKEIARLHSYDVPEIIALPIAAGSAGYLAWLKAALE
jgi:periplasmic divalent cation tolerance protein